MINKVEYLRKINKVKQSELCLDAGISVDQYRKYVRGNKVPHNVLVKMFSYFDYVVVAIPREELTYEI